MINTAPIDPLALNKLRWRCRRGLLENDLFIERFFSKHAQILNVSQARGLDALMSLSDNDLLDLFLARTQLSALKTPELKTEDVHYVLEQIRTQPCQISP